jgi:orotate phosphoribosyltransferase
VDGDYSDLKTRLIGLLNDRSVRHGSFRLASGKTSAYYVDARKTTMCAAGLEIVGRLGLAAIREARWDASLVGGLTLGADPVAYAIAAASRSMPPDMNAFTIRKEPKAHGTGQQIEGCFEPGARVVVVEDVVTSGGSALRAIEAVVGSGGLVAGVLAVVDRDEGGRASIESAGHHLTCLVTLTDLGLGARS